MAKKSPQTDSFLQALAKQGVKLTEQRKFLVSVIDTFTQPFSAEDLHKKAVQKKSSRLDLATVYRSLNLWESLGLLQKSEFGDGIFRYCVAHEKHHHHHILCRECHRIETIDFCLMQKQQKNIEKMGFTQVLHKLEFIGLCPNCSR